jgi:ankyrin repeat protein
MAKKILLRSFNGVIVSLGALWSLSPIYAIRWEKTGGILHPQSGAVKASALVRYGEEANPIAVVEMPDVKVGEKVAEAPAYQSLSEVFQVWLQRLGIVGSEGCLTRKLSVTYVVHQYADNLSNPTVWCHSSDVRSAVAIKFLPLMNGQIVFDLPSDQSDRRDGLRIQSLPSGFTLRQFPFGISNDDWWRVTISGNDPERSFVFAAIVVWPGGDVAVTVEIMPSYNFTVENSAAEIERYVEELLYETSRPNYFCLVPYEFDLKMAVKLCRNALRDNEAETVRRILPNVNAEQRRKLLQVGFGGQTSLHLAAQRGYTEIVKILLENDVKVDVQNRNGQTPLHFAAQKGHPEIVEVLLGNGAMVDARDAENWTPLHFAAQGGRAGVVGVLLGKGAMVDARSKNDQIPLHFAAQEGHPEIVEVLLGNGAMVDARDTKGRTPLHLAARGGHARVVGVLLGNSAMVDTRSIDGQTPLHFAARGGCAEAVEMLLRRDVEIDAQDTKGRTPLHVDESSRRPQVNAANI